MIKHLIKAFALAALIFGITAPANAYWSSVCTTVTTQPLGSGYVRGRCQWGYTGAEYLTYSHVTTDCEVWWALSNSDPIPNGAVWLDWDHVMHATHSPGHTIPAYSLDWPCGEGWWEGVHTITGKKRSDGTWDYVVVDSFAPKFLNSLC